MIKKLQWPPQYGYTEKMKENKLKASKGGLPVRFPRDGRQIGFDRSNIAVADLEQLASEPLHLRLDRTGRTVLEGEKVDAAAPWSVKDVGGRSSAAAPLSWEEFHSRYRRMDKPMERQVGQLGLGDLNKLLAAEDGQDDFRTVRTFSWPREDGSGMSTIMLIGVAETSARSRKLAAQAVYEAEPSALLVQLCRERIGRHLVMPAEHLATVASYARGFSASNPHRLRRELYMIDIINGDYEALKLWMSDLAYGAAVDEFAQTPSDGSLPKLLCLGDVQKSKLERLRKQQGNHTMKEVPVLSARGKQLVRGLIALASMGHKVVLGVVSVDLLATATTWLERAGARLVAVADASDIEQGRESIAADVKLGLQAKPKAARKAAAPASAVLGFGQAPLGTFLNEQALQVLQQRKHRLAKMTRVSDLVRHCDPPKVWKVAELLGGEGPTPGPLALRSPPTGLRFEFGHLEVPDHYLRDVGMEAYAPTFWRSLCSRGLALETRGLMELVWWAAGATEGAPPASDSETDEEEEEGMGAARAKGSVAVR